MSAIECCRVKVAIQDGRLSGIITKIILIGIVANVLVERTMNIAIQALTPAPPVRKGRTTP